jgi:hypothetical protein
MAEYKVSLEIQLDAKNPLEAAKTFESWIKEVGEHFQYHVQEENTPEIFSVDLNEEDEDAVLPVKPEDYNPIICKI